MRVLTVATAVSTLVILAPGLGAGKPGPDAFEGRRTGDVATPGAFRKDALPSGPATSYWVAEFRRRWKAERADGRARARTIRRLRSQLASVRVPGTVHHTICLVFGPYCGQALRVVECESHFHTGAANGQYRGLFQMGSHERATYGHGLTALEQAMAAHRYFVASGRDWSPWACRP